MAKRNVISTISLATANREISRALKAGRRPAALYMMVVERHERSQANLATARKEREARLDEQKRSQRNCRRGRGATAGAFGKVAA